MNKHAFALALVGTFCLAAEAQTRIDDPWVRGTVPHQQATGAFMTIVSPQGGRLVQATSPVAGIVEIHEMKMENEVMRMKAIDALDLPAGRPVQLKPGGYHVMLMDLKQPLAAGTKVPLTLVVEGRDGKRETIQLLAPVRALTAGGPMQHGH